MDLSKLIIGPYPYIFFENAVVSKVCPLTRFHPVFKNDHPPDAISSWHVHRIYPYLKKIL